MTTAQKKDVLACVRIELMNAKVGRGRTEEDGYGGVSLKMPKRVLSERNVADALIKAGWVEGEREIAYGGMSGSVALTRQGVTISVSGSPAGCFVVVKGGAK